MESEVGIQYESEFWQYTAKLPIYGRLVDITAEMVYQSEIHLVIDDLINLSITPQKVHLTSAEDQHGYYNRALSYSTAQFADKIEELAVTPPTQFAVIKPIMDEMIGELALVIKKLVRLNDVLADLIELRNMED